MYKILRRQFLGVFLLMPFLEMVAQPSIGLNEFTNGAYSGTTTVQNPQPSPVSHSELGWTFTVSNTGTPAIQHAVNSGEHYLQFINFSGSTFNYLDFGSDDGSEFSITDLDIAATLSSPNPATFTFTGYRDGISVPGASYSQSLPRNTSTTNFEQVDLSGVSAFNNVDKVRVEITGATGSFQIRLDKVTIGAPVVAAPTTTWNGVTWSNGAPDANTDAIIDANVSTGSFTCKDLTINPARAFIFNSGQTVTVTGSSVTNNGFGAVAADATGNFVFDNDGNSIDLTGGVHSFRGIVTVSGTTTLNANGLLTLTAPSTSSSGQLTGTGTVNGNISMQAFLDAGSGGRYYYIGSPFTNATLSDFNEPGAIMVSANTGQGTAWEWDAANAEWDPAGTTTGTGLASTATRGRGYTMYAGMNGAYGPFLIDDGDQTGTITLTGTTNNDATVSTALSYNDGQATTVNFVTGGTVNDTEGWNLVANPYAAIYDWDGQAIPTDMSSAIYRFNGTNYFAYIKGAGSASRYIAPFQGFFVQLTDNTPGNLVFDRDNRAPSQSATLSKTASYVVDGVSLHIEGQNGNVYDDVFAGFDANATPGFDNEWDARKLLNKAPAPNMYVQFGQDAYSVCRVAPQGPWSFPLKLDYATDQDAMTISADISQLQSFAKVELEDKLTGNMYDLTNGTYSFTHNTSFGPDRFVLHFSQNTVGVEEDKFVSNIYAFSTENGIQLELGTLNGAHVEVFNLSGQVIYTKLSEFASVKLPLNDDGIYLIRVSTPGNTETLKVIR